MKKRRLLEQSTGATPNDAALAHQYREQQHILRAFDLFQEVY